MPRRRHLLSIAAAALLSACAPQGPNVLGMAPGSTLVALHHAEGDAGGLTGNGRAGARALVPTLARVPIDALYAPDVTIHRDSLVPLAGARGLPIRRAPRRDATDRLTREGAGQSIVWVGDADSLATLWADLDLPGPPPRAFGTVHIIRADTRGALSVERRPVAAP